MKDIVLDLNTLTDSDIILNQKTRGFSRYIFILILIITITSFVWSIFAEKEIITKANGEIIQSEGIRIINSSNTGIVSMCDLKDEMEVKAGQKLFEINTIDNNYNKNITSKNLENYKNEINTLSKYKKDIEDNTNTLDKNDELERKYYLEYEQYRGEVSKLENIVAKNNDAVNDVNDEVMKLQELKNSISLNKSLQESTKYYLEYIEYQNKLNNITDINQKQNYKISKLSEINTKIEVLNKELKSIDNNYVEDIKLKYLIAIEDSMKNIKVKINDLQDTLISIENKEKSLITVATNDGKLNLQKDIKSGDFIVLGEKIGEIVTKDNEKFKIKIMVESNKLDDFKIGDIMNINLSDKNNPQYVDGEIIKINSTPIVIPQSGQRYYEIECDFLDKELERNNGNISLKNGMSVEVKRINRKISYFNYLLEMLNIA